MNAPSVGLRVTSTHLESMTIITTRFRASIRFHFHVSSQLEREKSGADSLISHLWPRRDTRQRMTNGLTGESDLPTKSCIFRNVNFLHDNLNSRTEKFLSFDGEKYGLKRNEHVCIYLLFAAERNKGFSDEERVGKKKIPRPREKKSGYKHATVRASIIFQRGSLAAIQERLSPASTQVIICYNAAPPYGV